MSSAETGNKDCFCGTRSSFSSSIVWLSPSNLQSNSTQGQSQNVGDLSSTFSIIKQPGEIRELFIEQRKRIQTLPGLRSGQNLARNLHIVARQPAQSFLKRLRQFRIIGLCNNAPDQRIEGFSPVVSMHGEFVIVLYA